MLVDFLMYDNVYHSTEEQWKKYFYPFAFLSNKQRLQAREGTANAPPSET